MLSRTATAVGVLAVAASILVGCVPAPTLSVPASSVAETAEAALEQQVGSRPEIDCGSGQVELRKGAVIDCILTDPATGDRFEAPVTIDSLEGSDYAITVTVAEEPIG